LFILALIVAGESVFSLPFIVARIFRPTLLDVLGITNLELGSALSFYGVVAMLCYFPGGPLADRFGPRLLMTLGLITTACGGFVYAKLPSLGTLSGLYAFWGVSSILLFWSALIRATRHWGGTQKQGLAYGLLDGGRGLLAALMASAGWSVFVYILAAEPTQATLQQKGQALSWVIILFTLLTLAAAVFCWFAMPPVDARADDTSKPTLQWAQLKTVLKMPQVWLQSSIVICAYVGYKGIDDFSLYARDVFAFNDVEAAGLGMACVWARPLAALGAGLLADRLTPSTVSQVAFLMMACGYALLGSGWIASSVPWLLSLSVITTGAFVYGLRGVYFALFHEAKVPMAVTGTAAGLVSVWGYTPDIFMGPFMGYLTDTFTGARGHHYFFMFISVCGFLGFVLTRVFKSLNSTRQNTDNS
jgi:sugar phosphate permease